MARSALSVGLALVLAAFLVLSCVSYAQATSEATGVDAAEDVARITQPNKAHEQRHRKLQTTADSTGFLKARSLLSLALSAQPGNAAALGNAAEVEEALGNAAAAHELFVQAHRAAQARAATGGKGSTGTGSNGQHRHGQQRAATGSTGTGSNGRQRAAQARAATGGNRQHRHGQQQAAQARAATGGNGQRRHGQQRAATGSTGTGSNGRQQAA
ncbi:unnamed protein product [Closterium sp. NIES-64]|nr:unnamed protein product [Closterium sp. NIES-64]